MVKQQLGNLNNNPSNINTWTVDACAYVNMSAAPHMGKQQLGGLG
jgi:hypothetical protein